jgi:hypothetical protein
MDYCGKHGIRHSKFMRWSQGDRDKALTWFLRERSKCAGCGVPHDEAGEYKPHTYRCTLCEKLQPIDLNPKTDGHGMYKHAVPVGYEEREVPADGGFDLFAARRGAGDAGDAGGSPEGHPAGAASTDPHDH